MSSIIYFVAGFISCLFIQLIRALPTYFKSYKRWRKAGYTVGRAIELAKKHAW